MKLSSIVLGVAAVVTLSAGFALAEDYAGGAVKTMEMGGKEVLTDANGMTLYTFDKDKAADGTISSTCYDKCAANWPPAFAAADAKAEGDFTLMERTDGKIWAYKGWPLYLWVKDTKPGDTTGDGVGGVWHTAVEQ